MPTFSERMGFVKPPEFIQIDGMNEALTVGLLNCCERRVLSRAQYLDEDVIGSIDSDILSAIKESYKYTVLGRNDVSSQEFRNAFLESKWYNRYDIIEVLLNRLSRLKNIDSIFNMRSKEEFVIMMWHYFNETLKRENSGYRLNEYLKFIPITNETELKEVEQTQKCEIDSVRDRFNHAVSLFSDRKKRYCTNAVQEAISAMESLAQHYTGNPSGTLGELITSKKMCKKTPQLISLPQPLKDAMSKLYGYASNEGNIRHGNLDTEHVVTFNEAKFIIVTASALINYIIALNPEKKEK